MITERHLYLAIEAYAEAEVKSKLYTLSLDTILLYVKQHNPHASDDELIEIANDLVINHQIDNAISDGLLESLTDEDGKEHLELTQKAIDEHEKI